MANQDNKNEKLKRKSSKLKQLKKELDEADKELEQENKKHKNKKPSGGNSGKGGEKKPNKLAIVIVVAVVLALLIFGGRNLFADVQSNFIDEISTSDFIAAVESDRVKNVVYDAGGYTVSGDYMATDEKLQQLNDQGIDTNKSSELVAQLNQNEEEKADPHLRGYRATFVGQDSLLELMQKHPNIQYEIKLPSQWGDIVATFLPILLIGLLMFFFFRQMMNMNSQQMGFGKTNAKKASQERPDVKFKDVAGVDEAVEEMREVKDFLAHPAKYQKMGAKIPRGCLLVGPPGTGKTLLARAVAGEAGVPFFNISGSDFVEMFVGVGASRVRDLFKQAKETAPSIIFIDEIDAVGRHRGAGLGGGHDEREQTLNQMLVEMDGFDKNDSVVLIAATNRADILDPALLRPGRFDRQIVVDTPDVKGREQILKVHSKGKPVQKSVDFRRIAQITPGFTGADLANLMNESALLSARKGKKTISQSEITESMERVIAGPERKSRIMDDQTKKTIAFHESGHALVGHLLPKADPVHKISIISRGRALGYTLSIPKEDKVLNSLGEMMDELSVFMGGRVAEEIFCDDITTGASNDLERATKMARSIVTQFGMSKELGTQVFGQPNHEVFLGRDYGNTPDYSEATAQRIDNEVSRIMKQAHDVAYKLLSTRKKQMNTMAAVLIERETIEGEACDALLDNKWDFYLAKESGKKTLKDKKLPSAKKTEDKVNSSAKSESTNKPASDKKASSKKSTVAVKKPTVRKKSSTAKQVNNDTDDNKKTDSKNNK